MRKNAILAAATLASLAFWATMLTIPPTSRAQGTAEAAATLDPLAMMRGATPPEAAPCDTV